MKIRKSFVVAVAFSATLFAASALRAFEPDRSVMSEKYWAHWNPEVFAKIDAQIEKHRKADATLELKNVQPGSEIVVEQRTHSFRFGSNSFLFGQFDDAEKNRKYAAMFGELFNGATVAFYWKTLEPEEGKIRFAADSPAIYRRPPTDPVVEFCESRGLQIHGHAMIYGMRRWAHPDWLPTGRKEMEPYFERHIRQLAERYDRRVQSWDVVNESIDQANRGVMPDDYTFKTFAWAAKYFSPDVVFSCNDCDFSYSPERLRRYVEIARDLTDRGAKLDLFGIQAHLFAPELCQKIADGEEIRTPKQIETVFNTIRDAELPIHVSEVTVSAPSDDARGQEVQAIIAANLYRIWFANPETAGITWWNAVDGGAAPGEPSWSGVLDVNCNPKRVYEALDDLINREWRTNLTLKAPADGSETLQFRGFRGKYRITWTDRNGEKSVDEYELR